MRILLLAIGFSLAWAAPTSAKGLAVDERTRALYMTDLLIRQGRLSEAEAWVRKNLATDSASGEWTLHLARILANRLEHKEAIKLYQKLLETRSDDAGLLFSLGRQAVEAEEFNLAREAFVKARELTGDPKAAYELSQLAFRRGHPVEGRRWAKLALVDLEDPSDWEETLLQMNLRSIFGYEPSFEKEFEALHAAEPKNASILDAWVEIMMHHGRLTEAEKPLSLLKDIPEYEMSWRKLEARHLSKREEYEALAKHLEESMDRFPGLPDFLLLRGDVERRRRCWSCAELYLSSATAYFDKRREANNMLVDIRDKGHHWIGPVSQWVNSSSAELTEAGAAYRGIVRPYLKVEAEVTEAVYHRKDGTKKGRVTGFSGTVAIERLHWIAGVSGDIRHDDGLTAVSPGAFAEWKPSNKLSLRGHFYTRRLSQDSVGEIVAGILTDEIKGGVRYKIKRPLTLKLDLWANRLTARAGGEAEQFFVVPGVTWRLIEKRFYLALGYEFYHLNASANTDFNRSLAITPKARTHFGTLMVSKYFKDGRFRTDAYVFSAEDTARERRFFSGNFVGFGLNFDYFIGRWKLSASYSQTREDLDGIGERSQRVRARLEWRWGPKARLHTKLRSSRHGR
ncbi:MAG: hypothetical protein COB53_04090 [Elusimicrobia bacterium]|nr:MAG: hypothetical protein COB53_04090 [Elusimicrobiota bacterium]